MDTYGSDFTWYGCWVWNILLIKNHDLPFPPPFLSTNFNDQTMVSALSKCVMANLAERFGERFLSCRFNYLTNQDIVTEFNLSLNENMKLRKENEESFKNREDE